MRSHRLLAGLRFSERFHKCFQPLTVGSRQVDFQCVSQGTFHPDLPAGGTIMQVRAASGQLARRIDHHPIRTADDAHQLSLCQYRATSNAGSLGYVFHALNGFLGHLRYKTSSVHHSPTVIPGREVQDVRMG
jgi:hypothetical protein